MLDLRGEIDPLAGQRRGKQRLAMAVRLLAQDLANRAAKQLRARPVEPDRHRPVEEPQPLLAVDKRHHHRQHVGDRKHPGKVERPAAELERKPRRRRRLRWRGRSAHLGRRTLPPALHQPPRPLPGIGRSLIRFPDRVTRASGAPQVRLTWLNRAVGFPPPRLPAAQVKNHFSRKPSDAEPGWEMPLI